MPLFGRRKAYQLSGLLPSPDGLYDGSFLRAAVHWWNHELEGSRRLQDADYRPFTADDAARLQAVVQPDNRPAFQALASSLSLPGRQSGAVLCLAYAFALVIDAGASRSEDAEEISAAWRQARPFTHDDLTELHRHYSEEGAAREYALWSPYWIAATTVFPESVGAKLINSLRASFDDQVDRWSTSEGFDLRRSIGAPDYSMIVFDEAARLPTFVDLLFEWGGRLRLGERMLAEGVEFADERFGHDPYDPIDHFYAEAFERYLDLASQEPPPISEDIELAIRMCVEWLGHDLQQTGRSAISTAAVRAYLWRTVEDGPVDFLEPDLTEAVKRSFRIGDDRGADEPLGQTYYFAASQCMIDDVKTRLGSLGGLIKGPRSYERAFWETTDDFEELGLEIEEDTKRQAFSFGVCLADAERVLSTRGGPH